MAHSISISVSNEKMDGIIEYYEHDAEGRVRYTEAIDELKDDLYSKIEDIADRGDELMGETQE